MFPFWEVAIAPVFDAVAPRRVVEIGALRGENTVQLFGRMGPECDLHVIDPDPQFDPSSHEAEFPGRYHFHRDLSLRVLPQLPPVDIALVDGDHNWYTVYNECRLLAEVALAAGEMLPVLLLHDVCWPYGRRDLYYGPDTIPDEHRQPFAQRGILRGQSDLVPGLGGLNPTMYNALHEGGPRNGVMTGLEDWMAEHPEPLRMVLLPIYFGLALVAEQRRLDAQPALAAVFDHLESAAGRAELLDLAEDTRLEAMVFQHNVFFHRERQIERAATRYLDLLSAELVGESRIDDEMRIDYLLTCIETGNAPSIEALSDPARWMREKARRLEETHRHGVLSLPAERNGSAFPATAMGRVRLDRLRGLLDELRQGGPAGDLVDCAPGRGGAATFLRGYLEAWEVLGRRVWVIDELEGPGLAARADRTVGGLAQFAASGLGDLNVVRDALARRGLLDDRVRFLQGDPTATVPDAPLGPVALLHIGVGRGAAAGELLELLYDRVPEGGVVMIDDYGTPECTAAVDAFRSRRRIEEPLERLDGAGAIWRRGVVADVGGPDDASPLEQDESSTDVGASRSAPLAPPFALQPVDLTVVVVFYNMRREAMRTLHSLTRAYQEGIDDLSYEVVVVENGSDPDQRLGAKLVRSFGPEFRYVDMGDDAPPTPVAALNRGIRMGRGSAFALMIDGAHVLSPGVLHFGMLGLATYGPAVVSTQQWYVGPGQQGEMMEDGYDQAMEDRLFESIGWPADGYRLFDISHFISERDWLDGMWESNCLFAPRSLLAQVGGFDEAFDMPGGGYANLDLYERLGSSPDVRVVTMLGEGSFHQTHGGTTTNQDVDDRSGRVTDYGQHYAAVRGRPFQGHQKPIHYVGRLMPHIVRTRARRRSAPNLFPGMVSEDPDGLPTTPTPIPEGLRQEFLDAFWRSLRWRRTTWLGTRVARPPTDLFAYQDLLVEVRPDWVVELGSGGGGRTRFLASICDLLDHGQVVSVDPVGVEGLPEHPRVTYVRGGLSEPETVARVRELVGDGRGLVIMATRRHANNVVVDFDAYSPLVPVGSYVVVEDTIVNGHPVWAAFGPGPAEAVKRILAAHPDFMADTRPDRWALTFNPGGFLRRVDRTGRDATS